MISAVAFCPQAPVLVPDLARGAAAELEELRAACRTAIRRLAAPGRQLVVLGEGTAGRDIFRDSSARGSFAGLGLDLEVSLGADGPGDLELPLSLTVGAWLLRDALGPDCGAAGMEVDGLFVAEESWDPWFEVEPDLGLLVVGDGSARRSVKAPGYLDERAAPYDASVVEALRGGDPGALAALDPALGRQLMAAGVPAWRRAADLLADPTRGTAGSAGPGWDAELLYAAAPYGVGYFVASWTARING